MQVLKKNRDPKWDEEFQFMLEEPPTDDKMHVEVVSTSKRMGLLHPKVNTTTFIIHNIIQLYWYLSNTLP